MRNYVNHIYEDYGFGWFILVLILALGVYFGIACLEAWIVMLLWNVVMPAIWASAPILSFWISFGLMLLCHMLFKSVTTLNNRD